MFGWGKQKSEIEKLIDRHGMDEAVRQCARAVGLKIPTVDIYRQFLLEELDAAQHGNAEAQAFVRSTGIPASEYNGAMRRSFPEVDGPGGPQQTLVLICSQLGDDSEKVARFRIAVVRELMNAVSRPPPEIRTEDDVHRLIQEQGPEFATRTLGRLALDGNLMCQIVLSQFGLQSLEEEHSEDTWRQCEKFTKMAAEQGDARSQFNLAELYFDTVEGTDGYLNARDHELIQKAKLWHRKAAAQGFADSIARLKKLEAFPDDAYEKVLESNRRRQELREKAPDPEPDEEYPF